MDGHVHVYMCRSFFWGGGGGGGGAFIYICPPSGGCATTPLLGWMVDDILDTLGGSKWFSTLDLKSGYWQVEVDSSSREKTAFTTSEGLYEFKVMPFGLCNAPATFQRLMNRVLCDVNWVECLVYIDDTVVIGRTFEQHLSNLGTVLSRLRQAQALNFNQQSASCVKKKYAS